MTDDNILRSNGPEDITAHDLAEPTASGMLKADDFLMRQARKNIKERQHLIMHVIVYVLALIPFFALYGHADAERLRLRQGAWDAYDLLEVAVQIFSAASENTPESRVLHQAVQEMGWVIQNAGNNLTPVFYFAMGVMVVWGAWVLVRAVRFIEKRWRLSSRKKARPDAVMREYYRLKEMTDNEV